LTNNNVSAKEPCREFYYSFREETLEVRRLGHVTLQFDDPKRAGIDAGTAFDTGISVLDNSDIGHGDKIKWAG
jgi:hypothetical protein